jgi:hypothetical protein
MFRPEGKPTRRWVATVAVLMLIILAAWYNQRAGLKAVARETQTTADQTHAALCSFRLDLRQRYDAGVEYLKSHPKGLVGDSGKVLISAAQIRDSLRNQESTLDSLDVLKCDTQEVASK